MRLRDWLESSGKTSAWLAGELGVTDRTVRRWINGTIRPDYDKLLQIEALSGGLVTPRDIIEHPSPKRGPGRPKLARLAIARV